MLEAIDRLNEEDATRELAVRIGVNTGDAFVALDARWGEGMAWGDMVNTAARIQSAAPPGGVLVGEQSYRLTRRWIDYDEYAPIEAKGKSQPVLVWRALGVAHGTAPGRPLVGRDAEFGALEALWQQVRSEGRPAFALVVGPPGIGKSRLDRTSRKRPRAPRSASAVASGTGRTRTSARQAGPAEAKRQEATLTWRRG